NCPSPFAIKQVCHVMTMGIRSWGPSSHEPMPRDDPLVIEDDQEIEIVETSQPISVATQSLSHPQAEKSKKKRKQVMTVVEEKIMGVLKIMAEKHNTPEPPTKTEKVETPTFDDCLKKLDEIGWDETSCTTLHLQFFVSQMIIIGKLG
ncbi:hypothetical protein Tco_1357119, partial [Tanacetum coccineum]